MRSLSWSSSPCCWRCRKGCSVAARSNGYEHAGRDLAPAGGPRRDRRGRHPAARVLPVGLLLPRGRVGVHLRAGGHGAQPADGLRWTGQPRPCRLSRYRELHRPGRPDPSRDAVVALRPRRRRALRCGCIPGGTANPAAQRTLPCGRHAGIWCVGRDRADQRGAMDWRSGRHVGAAARAVRLAGAWIADLVLDRRGDVRRRRDTRAQSDRQPYRTRTPSYPWQRGGILGAGHRRGAPEAGNLRGLGDLCLGRGLVPRAVQRSHHTRDFRIHPLDRAGGDGGAGRYGLGRGLVGRCGRVDRAAADADRVARLRARGAGVDPDGIHDPSATRHRAGPDRPAGRAASMILQAEELSIAFGGVHAVNAVSFAVEPGTVFSIIGPNGAGKTTLFNLISGLYVPATGSVRLAGEDVTGLSADRLARRGLSRTFQNLQIFLGMTALENVMVGRHRHEATGILANLLHLPAVARQNRATRVAAAAAIERVGLSAHATRPAGSLPYGALKRLEIARALASEPKVLLLDEPAAGCNPVETAEIEAIIRQFARDGITVVLVEHDMRLVMNISDRIHVLANGRTLAEGTARQVRTNPAVIEAYLGAQHAQEKARAAG